MLCGPQGRALPGLPRARSSPVRHVAELNVSYATVDKHISNAYVKLHVHSVNEAMALAVRKELA
jgi:hypothetical protein